VFEQVKIDQLERNEEIRFIKVIFDIPSDLTELLSFLDSSMEE
jgi:hypothetical protein